MSSTIPGVEIYQPEQRSSIRGQRSGISDQRSDTRTFRELPPLSLYIHIPWCIKKCPYCDFNSHEQKGDLAETEYIDALLADLEQELPLVWGRTWVSVFIGGGTPSLFKPESIEHLLSGVRALTALPPDAEITMEANPGTFEQQRFREFRDAGINRLSIGIQSFNDIQLQALGRVHGAAESYRAAEIAIESGFDNLNLDLMFGLPQQSLQEAQQDLRAALDAAPTHISYYQLTMEPNTLFHKFPPQLPSHDDVAIMQERAVSELQAAGYQRYEISAWSMPGKQCRHNLNYWNFGDYVGIGAGAHGKISDASNGSITRRTKLRHPQNYLASAGSEQRIDTQQQVAIEDTGIEFMMNALRLTDGFSPAQFREYTGLDLHLWHAELQQASDDGLLEYSVTGVKPTQKGLDFLNDLLELFTPAAP